LGSWFGVETSTARKKAAMTLQTSKVRFDQKQLLSSLYLAQLNPFM
jgi:hypothetical protein